MQRTAAKVVLAGLGACGVPSTAKTTTASLAVPHVEIKTYRPREFAVDARATETAVILGIDDHDRSLVLPLPWQMSPSATSEWHEEAARAQQVIACTMNKNVLAFPFYVDVTTLPRSSVTIAVAELAAATGMKIEHPAVLDGRLAMDGSIIAAGASTPVDLAEAYQLATGKHLPQPAPVPASQLALDASAVAALDARYQASQRHLAAEWATILQLDSAGRLPTALATAHALAHSYVQRAVEAHRRGDIVESYAAARHALVYADAAAEAGKLLALVRDGDVTGVAKVLAVQSEAVDVQPTWDALHAAHPTALAGYLAVAATELAAIQARTEVGEVRANATMLDTRLGTVGPEGGWVFGPDVADRLAEQLVSALLTLARARLAIDDATDELTHVAAVGPPCSCELDGLDGPDSTEPSSFTEDVLATEQAYGIELDPIGHPTAIRDPDGLPRLLVTADRRAREMAHAARVATGEIPLQVRIAYQLAIADRGGDLPDHLDALVGFWRTTELARLAIALARQ